uniref:Uncharacterized protein n=1 Tax=mine drainage metagenome TaxID=410659 RepID=E6QMR7_9ZZZZ
MKWTAGWLTIRLPQSSRQVRTCWWQATPFLVQAMLRKTRRRCWRRHAGLPSSRVAGRLTAASGIFVVMAVFGEFLRDRNPKPEVWQVLRCYESVVLQSVS